MHTEILLVNKICGRDNWNYAVEHYGIISFVNYVRYSRTVNNDLGKLFAAGIILNGSIKFSVNMQWINSSWENI